MVRERPQVKSPPHPMVTPLSLQTDLVRSVGLLWASPSKELEQNGSQSVIVEHDTHL